MPTETTNITLRHSQKERILTIIPSIIMLAVILFIVIFVFNNQEPPPPRIVPIICYLAAILIIFNIISTVYKMIFSKIGIIFNEEGITDKDKEFPAIKWEEIKDIEIDLGNIFVIEIKSMDEYVKQYDFFERNYLLLIAYITKKPIKNEVVIDLKEYEIKDSESLEEQLQFMKAKHLGISLENKMINKVLPPEKMKFILYYPKTKPILRALSSGFILIVITSPLIKIFKYVIGDPKLILIVLLILGFVVIANLILNVYRIIFPKVGVIFNEKGIIIQDEIFTNIKWDDVEDMEIGRKRILYIKMKSIEKYWRENSLLSWKFLSLMTRITKEPIEDEIEIDLKIYAIKDKELFREKLKSMKEKYIESTPSPIL